MTQTPLAERLRPQVLEDVVGQGHLIGSGKPLTLFVEKQSLPSLIFWGPPGSGKTTLAHLIARACGKNLTTLSAIFSGVSDLRRAFEEARKLGKIGGTPVLFVDEIHRFNKAQQDSFLPPVEKGDIILIGATTENPSFTLNNALLSRCQVLTLTPLDYEALEKVLQRAEREVGQELPLTPEARQLLLSWADGDGRALLNHVEILLQSTHSPPLTSEDLQQLLTKRAPQYDKGQEEHYNLISALHKSLRGSDPDAALYWFARMIIGGEDPLYIGRRLIRFASEDIGLADPQALSQTLAGVQAFERLGSPEGELALVQVILYLATAPKSNAVYTAFKKVFKSAKAGGSLAPPKHILNAPTTLMKKEGYGSGYIYDHDTPEGFSGQNYFPESLKRQQFYTPADRGFEREIQKRLTYWARLRQINRRHLQESK